MPRFSLRGLLFFVLAVSVVCFVIFGQPHWFGALVFTATFFFLPPAILAGIVFCRGYGKAFSIGCISAGGGLPFLYFFVIFGEVMDGIDLDGFSGGDMWYFKIYVASFLGFVGLSGLVGMLVRWLAVRAQSELTTPVASRNEYSVLQSRVTRLVSEEGEREFAKTK